MGFQGRQICGGKGAVMCIPGESKGRCQVYQGPEWLESGRSCGQSQVLCSGGLGGYL